MTETMTSWLGYLRIPAIATSGIVALSSSLLYFKQTNIIYPSGLLNSRVEVPEPDQFQVSGATSLFFPTPDGQKLHAYYIKPNTLVRKNITILSFHGNAGNIGHRLPIAKVLSESLGCHVFMPEYRGYGLSTGQPDEAGLTIDAQTALDYVRSHPEMSKTKIVIYGQSLGGAVAVRLVASNLGTTLSGPNNEKGSGQPYIAGVILENTFLSIRKLIPSVMPVARYITLLCHQRWPSDETIQTISADGPPILFLSGLQDEIVPPTMMRTLFELCKIEQKTWRAFPKGDHNSTVSEPGYFEAIWDFLSQEVLRADERRKGTNYSNTNPDDLWT